MTRRTAPAYVLDSDSHFVRVGESTVTGSLSGVETGLSTISAVFAIVRSSSVPLAGALSVTADWDGGSVDLYTWTAPNVPALLPATVSWVAVGAA